MSEIQICSECEDGRIECEVKSYMHASTFRMAAPPQHLSLGTILIIPPTPRGVPRFRAYPHVDCCVTLNGNHSYKLTISVRMFYKRRVIELISRFY